MVSLSGSTTAFKRDEVLVLLGAGASVEAGIPHSAEMVSEIEKLLSSDWSEFKDLYNYVRSAIFYAEGIRGVYGESVGYNIERLVVSLDELARREEHPLYPFIGAWNPRLTQVAGLSFDNVTMLRKKILERLRHQWIEIENYDRANYFTGLVSFQKELNFPLHVFTLNYDLCVEKAYQKIYNEYPERGFGKDRFWSHGLLDESPEEASFYLYKLHGSIDWIRDVKSSRLTFSDSTSKIPVDEGELIFGTAYKLQYVDPFLYQVYQLRRRSLEARLIVVIGYGFADEHINGILKQALRGSSERRIVAVNWVDEENKDGANAQKSAFQSHVFSQLGLLHGDEQVRFVYSGAKKFLKEELTLQEMSRVFPAEESLFDELPAA